MQRLVCIDFETHLIGPGKVHPKPVVLSVYDPDRDRHELLTALEHDIPGYLRELLGEVARGEVRLVNQSLFFDAWVSIKEWPELYFHWKAATDAGECWELETRSKLRELQAHGKIESMPTPSGDSIKINHDLASLAMRHLGLDISDDKKEDSWRLRYSELENVPLEEWPYDARRYALADTKIALNVWKKISNHQHIQSQVGEQWVNRQSFALHKIQDHGMRLDPVYTQNAFEKTREQYDQVHHLIIAEIIIPAQPAQPHKGGHKDHVEDCSRKDCDCPVKMSAPTKQKTSTKNFKQYVLDYLRSNHPDCTVKLTDTGVEQIEAMDGKRKLRVPVSHPALTEKPTWISVVNEEMLEQLAVAPNEVLKEYMDRAVSKKLIESFFPGLMWDHKLQVSGKVVYPNKAEDLRWADRVHFNFDPLKRSGRTSSYGGSLYPSVNGQQVPDYIRQCFIADPGHFLVSIDYSALELYSAAWQWKRTFGYSRLYDLLSAGLDPHAYLGAQLAAELDPRGGVTASKSPMERYEEFMLLKRSDDIYQQGKSYFAFWRTFAKPVGLGFPGGLGIPTMIALGMSMYGIHIKEEDGKRARDIWLATFPEAREYLEEWSFQQKDPFFKTDEGKPKYQYTSPLGIVRRSCRWTQLVNGNALQTPAAEGLRVVVYNAVAATMDPQSLAYGLQIVNVIHDELLVQVPIFEPFEKAIKAIEEIESIMVDGMGQILQGMPLKTESAAHFRWHKFLPQEFKDEGWFDFDPRRPIDKPPTYFM